MLQQGHARDLLTLADLDAPMVRAEDRFTARLTLTRQILEIDCEPARPGIGKLVGARAGGQLRAAIARALPGERERGTPLYLLLDDIAGSSLVAPWTWSLWIPDWHKVVTEKLDAAGHRRSMEGVCIGFRPGSSALVGGGLAQDRNRRQVPPLDAGEDRYAWHHLPQLPGAAGRRARRIDVRVEGEEILIDAHFQDSATAPSGERWAVHEYLLSARADRETLTLQSIVADPRVLPHDQCPSAILSIGRLVGTPLSALRDTVLTELARTEGCTHLNDMVRSLAEVPQLTAMLLDADATH